MPSNVKFEVDDCEESWTFPEKFDFIHSRYMVTAIADWPKLMRQAFKFTKPGGYAEFQDFDITYYSDDPSMGPDRAMYKWIHILLKGIDDFGRDPYPGPKLEGWMKDAGFVDVVAHKYKIPIGPWAKDKQLVCLDKFSFASRSRVKVREYTTERADIPPRNTLGAGTLSRSKKVSRGSRSACLRSTWVGSPRKCKCFLQTSGKIFETRRCTVNSICKSTSRGCVALPPHGAKFIYLV